MYNINAIYHHHPALRQQKYHTFHLPPSKSKTSSVSGDVGLREGRRNKAVADAREMKAVWCTKRARRGGGERGAYNDSTSLFAESC